LVFKNLIQRTWTLSSSILILFEAPHEQLANEFLQEQNQQLEQTW